VWLVYTLLRGAQVGWYPYFFLDETQVGGLGGVLAYCAIVLLIFVAVTAVLVAVHRGLERRGVRRRVHRRRLVAEALEATDAAATGRATTPGSPAEWLVVADRR
jgi:hypothetical protein